MSRSNGIDSTALSGKRMLSLFGSFCGLAVIGLFVCLALAMWYEEAKIAFRVRGGEDRAARRTAVVQRSRASRRRFGRRRGSCSTGTRFPSSRARIHFIGSFSYAA